MRLRPGKHALQDFSKKKTLDEIRRRIEEDVRGPPIPLCVNGTLHALCGRPTGSSGNTTESPGNEAWIPINA